jgi:hypothetical protein
LKAKAEEEAAAAATVPQQKQLKKRKPSKELPIEDAQLQLEKAAEDKASAAKKVPEIEVAKADISEKLTSDETIALKAKAEEEAAAAATVPQQKQLKKRKPSKELPIEEASAQLQLEKTEVEKSVEKPTEAVDETPIMSGFAPVEEEKKAKKKVSKKKVDEVSEVAAETLAVKEPVEVEPERDSRVVERKPVELEITFVKELQRISISEGSTAVFRCELNVAQESVVWYKNGDRIDKTEKYDIAAEGVQHSLTIHDVIPEDQARYSARTGSGIETSAQLFVEGIELRKYYQKSQDIDWFFIQHFPRIVARAISYKLQFAITEIFCIK